MIGFLIIFGSSIAGYTQTGVWIVALASLGLLAISYAERQRLITRAIELGKTSFAETSLLASIFNAACATGAAYVFGLLLRLV